MWVFLTEREVNTTIIGIKFYLVKCQTYRMFIIAHVIYSLRCSSISLFESLDFSISFSLFSFIFVTFHHHNFIHSNFSLCSFIFFFIASFSILNYFHSVGGHSHFPLFKQLLNFSTRKKGRKRTKRQQQQKEEWKTKKKKGKRPRNNNGEIVCIKH